MIFCRVGRAGDVGVWGCSGLPGPGTVRSLSARARTVELVAPEVRRSASPAEIAHGWLIDRMQRLPVAAAGVGLTALGRLAQRWEQYLRPALASGGSW